MSDASVAVTQRILQREMERAMCAALTAACKSFALTDANRAAIIGAAQIISNASGAADLDAATIDAQRRLREMAKAATGDQRDIYRGFAQAVEDARITAMGTAGIDWFATAKAILRGPGGAA